MLIPLNYGEHDTRLEALKILKQFYTHVFCLPYLTDLEETFREVSPFVNYF